ncbi:MAG: hypothetical protein L0219_07610 [Phycisphaerales bacterium]|nr:hypothetical protein [Phycisphaerales bacterium]MCI0677189.1 hypothetical protein [Phycisphaerales bacterium]
MAKCDYCSTTILFGGVRDGNARYCNQRCHQFGWLLARCNDLPDELVDEQVLNVHGGPCPRCKGPGPIDVHTAYRVWSLIVITATQNDPQVCCRSCGRKRQLGGFVFSLLAGWWGFPAGLIITPITLTRNVMAMFGGPSPDLPSTQLEQAVRMQIGAAIASSQRDSAAAPPTAQPLRSTASR